MMSLASTNKRIIFAVALSMLGLIVAQSFKLHLIQDLPRLTYHQLNYALHSLALFALLFYLPHISRLLARTILLTIFFSLITAAIYLWRVNLNIHYYYLLILLFAGYLFQAHESKQLVFIMLSSCGFFIAGEYITHPLETVSWLPIKQTNALVFALACLFTAAQVRLKLIQKWAFTMASLSKKTHFIEHLFPTLITRDIVAEQEQVNDGLFLHHPQATVIFIDIEGYSTLNQEVSDISTLRLMHQMYQLIDTLALKHKIEKIKTNGDQYMAASGLYSLDLSSHQQIHMVEQACSFAIAVRQTLAAQLSAHGLSIRLGIATGPLISGVLGKHKPLYDLWGQTVILAARLEAQAGSGRIAVCATTQLVAQQTFLFAHPQRSKLKGLGIRKHYLLLGRK